MSDAEIKGFADRITANRINHLTFAHAEMAETPVVITNNSALLCSCPQIAVRGFKQTGETIIDDARRIVFVENREFYAIKPRQSVQSRRPQITFFSLNNSID